MTDPLSRPVRIDYKALLVDLTKLVIGAATGNLNSALKSGVDVAAAFGLDLTPDPHAQAAALVAAALNNAVVELVRGHTHLFAYAIAEYAPAVDPDDAAVDLVLDRDLFDHPERAPHVEVLHPALIAWFVARGLDATNARTVTVRLGHYYAAALAREWREHEATYAALTAHLASAAAPIEERRRDWRRYHAELARRPHEPLFADSVSLEQVYQPLRAYRTERTATAAPDPAHPAQPPRTRRVVVDATTALSDWTRQHDPTDAVRVIAGGPGAGKSSLARMFAAARAEEGDRVLLIELHRFALTDDLAAAVNRFGRDHHLRHDALDHLDADPLLLIFDGLDELAIRGSAGRDAVVQLVDGVRDLLLTHNRDHLRLRALLLGREVVVDAVAARYKRAGQLLTLLPYTVPPDERRDYYDPDDRLAVDQRHGWWQRYGEHTGRAYAALPRVLDTVAALTAEPLLNYLVALALEQGVDFSDPATSRTDVYRALVEQVFDRVHACPPGARQPQRLKGLEDVDFDDFLAFLRQIAIVAWHGEGRTAALTAIEARVDAGLLGKIKTLTRGARDPLSRLIAAFYFRPAADADVGDPTFEFTHQSFAEYLIAAEILAFLDDLRFEADTHRANSRRGWSSDQQLIEWMRLFGPAAIEPNVLSFTLDGLRQRARTDTEQVRGYTTLLSDLIGRVLTHDFPLAGPPAATHLDTLLAHSRNAGEALLVLASACAEAGGERAVLRGPEVHSVATWLRRLQPPRVWLGNTLAVRRLSHLDFSDGCLDGADFFGANLQSSCLVGVDLYGAILEGAALQGANLEEAQAMYAILQDAAISSASLRHANLEGASLGSADLSGADLSGADLREANLTGANFSGANLSGAQLRGAIYDRRTRWPTGFDPVEVGAVEFGLQLAPALSSPPLPLTRS